MAGVPKGGLGLLFLLSGSTKWRLRGEVALSQSLSCAHQRRDSFLQWRNWRTCAAKQLVSGDPLQVIRMFRSRGLTECHS